MKEGYIKQPERKKILLLCDDIRMTSGISTMAREIVLGTAHHYNWVNVGGAINHPDQGKRFDLNADTNQHASIDDANVIDNATGEYFLFVGNDDRLLPNHFEHYLSEIENTDYDLVAYNSDIMPENRILIPKWEGCQVGHGNIIIKTDTLKKAPKVQASSTHDWSLIDELIKMGAKTKLAESQQCTYLVTSVNSQTGDESVKIDIID